MVTSWDFYPEGMTTDDRGCPRETHSSPDRSNEDSGSDRRYTSTVDHRTLNQNESNGDGGDTYVYGEFPGSQPDFWY